MASRETLALIDRLMLEMIAQQESKVLAMARAIHPGLTPEDIRNPNDFADLMASGEWNFEDGILSGLKSAHMALRAKLLETSNKKRHEENLFVPSALVVVNVESASGRGGSTRPLGGRAFLLRR